jgi:cold shock CspA family protein
MSRSFEIQGTVKWFDAVKGYGFVVFDDQDSEAFVHNTTLKEYGAAELHDGALIQCEVVERPRGYCVTRIIWIDDALARLENHKRRARWSARDRACWLLGRGYAVEDVQEETGLPNVDILDLAAAAAHEEAAGAVATTQRVQPRARRGDHRSTPE